MVILLVCATATVHCGTLEHLPHHLDIKFNMCMYCISSYFVAIIRWRSTAWRCVSEDRVDTESYWQVAL